LSRESHPFRSQPPNPRESKEEREERALEETRRSFLKRYAAEEEEEEDGRRDEGEQPGLWMAGERWRRDDVGKQEDGLTLVMAHANGFTKEVGGDHLFAFMES